MNASPTNTRSAPSLQLQPQEAKPQGRGGNEDPFSRILSKEIAQHRSETETRKKSAENPAASETDSAPATEAKAARPAKTDDDAVPAADASTPDTALQSDPMPGWAHLPDQLKPVLPRRSETLADTDAVESAADDKSGRSSKGSKARMMAEESAVTLKADPARQGKAAASGFAAQLATSRQLDVLKSGDAITEPISGLHARAASHTALETAPLTNGLNAGRLAPSVGTTAWSQALGEKIVWMAAGTQQTASLTLNPPNMGQLQIVLNISNDQATASFFSAQPDVRHALEAAFPRLREMMSEAGIELGQASVSAENPQQQNPSDSQALRDGRAFDNGNAAHGTTTPDAPIEALRSGRGLVDTFA